MPISEITGVQRPVVAHAKKRGWKVCWKMKIEGRNGCPDFWFLRDGEWIVIEFKRPGGKLSAQQERRIAELRENGQPVHVIDNPEDGKALFDL